MEKNLAHPQEVTTSAVASFFEKVQEPQWVSRLAMAVLFSDIVLIWRTGTGIRHWAFDGTAILLHAGEVLVGLLALGILSAFLLPVAHVLSQVLVCMLYEYLPNGLKSDRRSSDLPLNCVHSSSFYEHVLRTRDPVLWDVWKDHVAQRRRQQSAPLASALPFSLLVLATVDFLLPSFGAQGNTLLFDGAAMIGAQGPWFLGSLLLTLPRFHVQQVMQPSGCFPTPPGRGSHWPSAGAGGCTSPRSSRRCPAWPEPACHSGPGKCARPSAS